VELSVTKTVSDGSKPGMVEETNMDNSLNYDQPPSSSTQERLDHSPVSTVNFGPLVHSLSLKRKFTLHTQGAPEVQHCNLTVFVCNSVGRSIFNIPSLGPEVSCWGWFLTFKFNLHGCLFLVWCC
jgi:hypothetical protein